MMMEVIGVTLNAFKVAPKNIAKMQGFTNLIIYHTFNVFFSN